MSKEITILNKAIKNGAEKAKSEWLRRRSKSIERFQSIIMEPSKTIQGLDNVRMPE